MSTPAHTGLVARWLQTTTSAATTTVSPHREEMTPADIAPIVERVVLAGGGPRQIEAAVKAELGLDITVQIGGTRFRPEIRQVTKAELRQHCEEQTQ